MCMWLLMSARFVGNRRVHMAAMKQEMSILVFGLTKIGMSVFVFGVLRQICMLPVCYACMRVSASAGGGSCGVAVVALVQIHAKAGNVSLSRFKMATEWFLAVLWDVGVRPFGFPVFCTATHFSTIASPCNRTYCALYHSLNTWALKTEPEICGQCQLHQEDQTPATHIAKVITAVCDWPLRYIYMRPSATCILSIAMQILSYFCTLT